MPQTILGIKVQNLRQHKTYILLSTKPEFIEIHMPYLSEILLEFL